MADSVACVLFGDSEVDAPKEGGGTAHIWLEQKTPILPAS